MTPPRPLFSVVTAVYNVEPYVPDFIKSIETQRFDLRRIEVIAVDDGSTDGSLALLQAWARRSPSLVKVLTKPNGGEGSARNLGLEHAKGEWVTFTDPDDMLDRDFFKAAHRFAVTHRDVEVLAGKPILFAEGEGRISDTHPRRQQYLAGNRRVDLALEPNTFTGVVAGSLFKLDRIRDLGLRFDTRIRPNFVDNHFAVLYLMSLPGPLVGILRDSKYIYRRRAANDSTMQRSWSHAGKYTDVLEFGYLDVLERAHARYGSVPAWLQHLLIYELSWYLERDEWVSSNIRMAPESVARFHDLLGQVLGYIEPEVVRSHRVRPLKSVWVDIFAYGCRRHDWHSPVAARTKVDPEMGLLRICYRYTGMPPREEFLLDGAPVEPAYTKTMSHTYYGRTLMHERIVWLPALGTLRVLLDGIPAAIANGWPEPSQGPVPPSLREGLWVIRRLPKTYLVTAALRRARNLLASLAGPLLRRIARGWPYRSLFRDAWALMDRVYASDDNAERLFEYLLADRRDINAWFVIERGTPDWKRMRAERVPRLVAYGSFRWKMLMFNCSWLLSSHADDAMATPPQMMRMIRQPTWKYAFLQHGVIKDDLSQWLNRWDMDLFVVSTQAELESVTANGTCYRFTARETRNTGLPRFDRLLTKGRQFPPDDRDLVIVAPTWRMWLTRPPARGSQRWAVDEAFWDSDYLRNWSALLRSPRIAEAAARRGWRIGFMPHPALQPVLAQMELPAHVEPLTFAGNDVQGLFARCALLVTDYSSVAFNTAYLDGPVVYFQFDREQMMMSGGHVGRQGYFDYFRDGFGPVATEVAEAVAAIVASIGNGPCPTPEYQARIDRTFVLRDGRACARVVAAVEELSRPYHPPSTTSAS